MKKLYIITGANGHLGKTIIQTLQNQPECSIRGLILPHEEGYFPYVSYTKGDITNILSLLPLFQNIHDRVVYIIHTAGIIDIQQRVSPHFYNVNVNGTKNLIALAKQFPIKRFLYVSSVHALPELKKPEIIREIHSFDASLVQGGYAKTKAEASNAVLEAANDGLPAIIVHPSGIIGPYGSNVNHLIQMIYDCLDHKLPATIQGGYDFVDVRDVANGCLLALHYGRMKECYILSNQFYTIQEIFSYLYKYGQIKELPVLPIWMAKILVPGMQ